MRRVSFAFISLIVVVVAVLSLRPPWQCSEERPRVLSDAAPGAAGTSALQGLRRTGPPESIHRPFGRTTGARPLAARSRERLTQGDSAPAGARLPWSDRYGEFVLLRPRGTWRTSLLALLPPTPLIGGCGGVRSTPRRRRLAGEIPRSRQDSALTAGPSKARLAALNRQKGPLESAHSF